MTNRHSLVPQALALSLLPSVAWAEVCDKAAGGESWRPDHGPVWLLNPANGLPISLLVLIVGLILAARFKWVGYVGAIIIAMYAAVLLFADLVPEHDIYLAQIREGCRSVRTDLMDLGLMITFAMAYLGLGIRSRGRHAEPA